MGRQVDRALPVPVRDERIDPIDVSERQISGGHTGPQRRPSEYARAHRSGQCTEGGHVEGTSAFDIDQQVREGVVGQSVECVSVVAEQSRRAGKAIDHVAPECLDQCG